MADKAMTRVKATMWVMLIVGVISWILNACFDTVAAHIEYPGIVALCFGFVGVFGMNVASLVTFIVFEALVVLADLIYLIIRFHWSTVSIFVIIGASIIRSLAIVLVILFTVRLSTGKYTAIADTQPLIEIQQQRPAPTVVPQLAVPQSAYVVAQPYSGQVQQQQQAVPPPPPPLYPPMPQQQPQR